MKKKNPKRRSIRLDLRVEPWIAYALRAYAKRYGHTLSFSAAEAIKLLISDIPKKVLLHWLKEFRRSNSEVV
jgi:hypothetical protein